jgi:hypothetical protein
MTPAATHASTNETAIRRSRRLSERRSSEKMDCELCLWAMVCRMRPAGPQAVQIVRKNGRRY